MLEALSISQHQDCDSAIGHDMVRRVTMLLDVLRWMMVEGGEVRVDGDVVWAEQFEGPYSLIMVSSKPQHRKQ